MFCWSPGGVPSSSTHLTGSPEFRKHYVSVRTADNIIHECSPLLPQMTPVLFWGPQLCWPNPTLGQRVRLVSVPEHCTSLRNTGPPSPGPNISVALPSVGETSMEAIGANHMHHRIHFHHSTETKLELVHFHLEDHSPAPCTPHWHQYHPTGWNRLSPISHSGTAPLGHWMSVSHPAAEPLHPDSLPDIQRQEKSHTIQRVYTLTKPF